MNEMRWLLRAKRWAQNPPSPEKVKFVFAIILVCIALVIYERYFGWPEWLTTEGGRRPRAPKF